MEMSRQYPRGGNFARKIFHQFFTSDTIRWFEDRGVKLKTEEDGRMFPVSDSSQSIINCLLGEINRYGVAIRMNAEVKAVSKEGGQFRLDLANGESVACDFVCIACGGYPRTAMFDWLRQTGHSIEEPVPSLFTFNLPGHAITKLMGVSVEKAVVKVQGSKLQQGGPLLITHWGLSGPAVLKLSAWGAKELSARHWNFEISVNWLPGYTEQSLAEKFRSLRLELASQLVRNRNSFGMPARLWEFLVYESGIGEDTRWADLPAKEQNRLVKNLCHYVQEVRGKTTFKEEFVTAGGIRLSEVDPNSLESKIVPGLFFAGEVLDVDGITGGYNFQHAWTSGFIAAKTIAHLSS
jgi:predicted Rossmann fold flavoprotein